MIKHRHNLLSKVYFYPKLNNKVLAQTWTINTYYKFIILIKLNLDQGVFRFELNLIINHSQVSIFIHQILFFFLDIYFKFVILNYQFLRAWVWDHIHPISNFFFVYRKFDIESTSTLLPEFGFKFKYKCLGLDWSPTIDSLSWEDTAHVELE